MIILKAEDGTSIIFNGPPKDLRCERCGKHIDELLPYDGEFPNSLHIEMKLFQNWRSDTEDVEYTPLIGEIAEDIKLGAHPHELEVHYGKSNYELAIQYLDSISDSDVVWECRNCWMEPGVYKHYTEKEE